MWLYNGKEFVEDMIEDHIGFVYKITNITNGKLYFGKKLFTKSKTYQKNKKRKRKRVSSDWKTYTGSNEQLNLDIASGHVVQKEILHLCKTKGTCSYLELKEQIMNNVLESDKYYNDQIRVRIHRSHIKL